MPDKKKRKRLGGLTRAPSIDYNDLREREAPKGNYRVIAHSLTEGFFLVGDFTDIAKARNAMQVAIRGDVKAAYIHSESNRVLNSIWE